ncbi:MAG: hypothetical protein DRQ35_06090 [Gammaproteobacteria bacterium]|nr:MAG: hypothetical protein DRQ35_06090 [Gammaproteobacteria bacterium]
MTTKVCKLAHCDEKHHCKEYCHLHYKRHRAGVDLYKPKQIKDPGRGCSVKGCKHKHSAKGMCQLHWSRVKTGTPLLQEVQEKNGKRGCRIKGCTTKHHSHGYCAPHDQRMSRISTKRKLVEQFGGKCTDCKLEFPFYIFDFDNVLDAPGHVSIGKLLDRRVNYAVLQEELKRCELVCANCHRTRTYSRYPELLEDEK